MQIKQLSSLLLILSLLTIHQSKAMFDIETENVNKEPIIEWEDFWETTEELPVTEVTEFEEAILKKAPKEKKVKKEPRPKEKPAKKRKVKTAKERKEALLKARKKMRKAKRLKTKVHYMGKFDKTGKFESFNDAAIRLKMFMEDVKNEKVKTNSEEKADLFRSIAKFNWVLGRKGFDTDKHYKTVVDLLKTASNYPKLFGKVKMRFIKRWLERKEAELKDPSKRAVKERKERKSKKEVKKKLKPKKRKKEKKKPISRLEEIKKRK